MKIIPYYEKTFTRHKNDIARVASGDAPHLRYNEKIGKLYIIIIQKLKHHTGVLAGKLIKLEAWQKKVIMISMGWERKHSEGGWVRRFRDVLLFVPRKNGKTLLLSALSIADTIIRGEVKGEVVFVGAKRDQAKIAQNGALEMIKSNEELNKTHTFSYGTITLSKNKTTFKTLGRDAGSEDGANNSFVGFDEKHAYPDTRLIDVCMSSMKARKQPVAVTATTAGFNNASPLIADIKYAKDILEGRIEDDSYFAFIAEAPADADIYDEETWIAANPNYGISIDKDNFKQEAMDAKNKPETLNNFKVKSLNIFVTVNEAFFNYEQWLSCAVKPKQKLDRSKAIRVILGLDLSLHDDMTSLITLFEFADGSIHLDSKSYIPKDTVFERERQLRAPLSTWVRQKYITATPGLTIDLDYIVDDIREQIAEHDIQFLAYDPYRARFVVKALEDEGFEGCVAVRQTTLGLGEAVARFMRDIRSNNVTHNDDKNFNWHISNTSMYSDSSGLMKPEKADPLNKIDCTAATTNAYALLTQDAPEEKKESIYNTRGMRSL